MLDGPVLSSTWQYWVLWPTPFLSDMFCGEAFVAEACMRARLGLSVTIAGERGVVQG